MAVHWCRHHVAFTYNETDLVRGYVSVMCGCGTLAKNKDPPPSYFDEKLGAAVIDGNAQTVIMLYKLICEEDFGDCHTYSPEEMRGFAKR